MITPNGPLASALNRHLDRPHLGPFAIPPRRLAAGRRQESEDRLAFLGMLDHEDISWKRCAYAVGNILQCWEHRSSHDAIDENADNVGIVLDRESEFPPLVESALEAADIPFFRGPDFTDRSEHRLFLPLLRTAHRGTDTRISEIRSLLTVPDRDVDDADGVVEEGDSNVNELMIAGESRAVSKEPDNEVIGGIINGDGSLRVRINATGDETTLAGIMRLVEEVKQSEPKPRCSPTERQAGSSPSHQPQRS